MKTISIIGLGRQTVKDHLPALYESDKFTVSGVYDVNKERMSEVCEEFGFRPFYSLEELVLEKPDCALVCVPHSKYFEILKMLASSGIHTLKEKPLAMTLQEASKILDLYTSNETILQVCVQRRFSKLYNATKELIPQIGKVYSLYAESTLNLESLDISKLGWRADASISGGGATLDLGYHMIDLVNFLFGLPDRVYAQLNYNSLPGDYDIDDSAKLMFQIGNINCNAMITKIFYKKCERIRIFGTEGFIWIDDRTVSLVDRKYQVIENHTFRPKDIEVREQINSFFDNVLSGSEAYWRNDNVISDQILNMQFIDAIYRSHSEKSVVTLEKK
ncbi:Gfo/Idh/MocA family oxidoreductase [Ruegeria sp. HKCCD4884]|uniref:Gfo/Idh/MocA family protein n=1 Tax=Ruegeria sp. HKCCD4884 TaxID=2683022 RepID=UPI001492C41F|nr:Gfo/Idh/MocA family oxidoreductase [Ruegeria sp. HKCCD4884]NOD93851.1 Gfo/Idh/MocA family oxidoreductase [Ruegeria sp. HKCCD4884]